jgi:hypothetical protein|uniref:hypothetical protein n=1 Tax=Prosthecobacter sp. TaxID=1965333 RepID=UPI00378471F6
MPINPREKTHVFRYELARSFCIRNYSGGGGFVLIRGYSRSFALRIEGAAFFQREWPPMSANKREFEMGAE